MDWTKSYTSRWRVFKVNKDTWADDVLLKKVDSAGVSRTTSGNALESGSLEVTGEFTSGYYRITMTAEQGGELMRVDVATLLFEVEGGEVNYGRTKYDVDGYSVLRPAETTSVEIGEYAPSGVDGAQYAAELLKSAVNAPVEVEGSFTLNDYIVFEVGETVLDAVWEVLDAGNFVIQLDGRGVIHIRPKPTEPSLIINSSSIRNLSNGISFSDKMESIPNRYIVIDGDTVITAINDDPNSPVSTVSRGYFVDIVDTSPTAVNGETLTEYANRRLKEESVLYDERTYVREYAPDVYLYSLVRASINGLQGDLRVLTQSIDCSNGIKVSEKSAREIALW